MGLLFLLNLITMRLFYALSMILLMYGCSCEQNRSAREDSSGETNNSLLRYKDLRDTEALIPMLADADPMVRARAAWAFGSVQDSKALTHLYKLLSDKDNDVRSMAAFAVGQTRDTLAESQLIYALQNEEDGEVRYRIADALGKCATNQGLEFLVSITDEDENWLKAQTAGIYRAALRKVTSDEGDRKILSILQKSNEEHTLNLSINYLRRTKFQPNPEQAESLAKHLGSPYWAVRTQMVYVLSATDHISTHLGQDQALETYLAILQTLKTHSDGLSKFATHQNERLAAAHASYLGRTCSVDQFENNVETGKRMKSAFAKAALWKNIWKRSSDEELKGYISSLALHGIANEKSSIYERAAMASVISSDLMAVCAAYPTESQKLNSLLLEHVLAAAAADSTSQGDLRVLFTKKVTYALSSQDPAQLYHIATFLQSERQGFFKEEILSSGLIDNALSSLELPRDIEAYWELEKLQAQWSGKDFKKELPKYTNILDAAELNGYSKHPEVILETSKGDVTIELYPDDAPGTVLKFLELVEQGFYDGKAFHRVVPNFVAQGGCPVGNGFGSLDETIRSEFSTHTYRTGSVGVASAGKDTESCQFFITHIPTPHLDGRYTLFGQVVEGMTTVQKLDVGDKITKAYLANPLK